MIIRYRVTDRVELQVEGSVMKENFKNLSAYAECFDDICGQCESDEIYPSTRTVDGNDFHELRCRACGARLSLGQHKIGGTLFPKRTVEVNGKEVFDKEHRGWHHWQPSEQIEPSASPVKKKTR